MKIQIRQGVFETNSSSTHSLCIYNSEDWERFKKGEMVIENTAYDPALVEFTEDIADKVFNPDTCDEIDDDFHEYLTYEAWQNIWKYSDYSWESLEKDVEHNHIVSIYQEDY